MNRSLIAFLLTAFSSLLATQLAYANRPAMEEMRPAMEEMDAPVTESEADIVVEDPLPETTSSVEMMMQQETQQTGDVIQLPAQEIQAGDVIRITLLDAPRRGMSMDRVQNEYGQPVSKSDSVGEPPITRWIYADRVVYFEYSTVLHVVARQ